MAQVPWEVDDTKPAVPWEVDDTVQPKPMGKMERFVEGLQDPIVGAAQLGEHAMNAIFGGNDTGAQMADDYVKQREQNYQAPEGMDWARMGGNLANPATFINPAGKVSLAKTLAMGAGQALLEPSTGDGFLADKAKQAALGGAVSGAFHGAVNGLPSTPEAKVLMANNIQPSVGQSMGGWANTLEQKLTSAPIIGDAVAWARNRPMQEFNDKVLREASGNLDVKTVDEADTAISKLYQDVAPHLPQHSIRPDMITRYVKALENPELTPANRKLVQDIVNDRLKNYSQLAGDQLKTLDSDLGGLIRKYAKSTDVSHHAVADTLREAQQAMRTTWEKVLPTELQGKLQTANDAFRRMVPVSKAASANADETIRPRALQKALARQANTDTARMPAKGYVHAAGKVLPATVPDSGSAGRILLNAATLGGGGMLGYLPEALIGGAAAFTGATRPVQKALLGNTIPQKLLAPNTPLRAAATVAALRGNKDKKK